MTSGGSPKFSICIRAHDRREGLRRAIRSALDQDVDDLEVVVSDDSGSLRAVADEADDRRVRYHHFAGGGGSIANLRHASALAEGEMVVVMDDDDRLLPTFLTVTGAAMEGDETVGLVFTSFLREAGAGRRAYTLPVAAGPVADPLAMLLAGHQPGRSATLMRRTALEQGERTFPLLDGHVGDLTTWLRTAIDGWGFWSVPEPQAIVSVHPGQLSASEDPARMIRTLERFEFEDGPTESLRLARLAGARRRRALALARHGSFSEARRELAAAAADAPRPPLREQVASLAAHAPALHRLSVRFPRVGAALRSVRARLDPGVTR